MTSKQQKPKRVAIVGFASTSRDLAPYTDKDVEVWSLNHAWSFIPRWDRWFEYHAMEHLTKDLPRNGVFQSGNAHFEWLSKQPAEKPIYMHQHHDSIPGSVALPYDALNNWLVERFGSEPNYFTSSISYMIALAMFEGFSEIGIYGVDLLNDDEYFYQRAGCEYLIGLARGMGIKVIVPKESALCKANYVYGLSEPPDSETAASRVNHTKGVVASLEHDMKQCLPQFHTFDGAHQAWSNAIGFLKKFRRRAALAEMRKQQKHAKSERDRWVQNMKYVEGGINIGASFVSWMAHDARGGVLTMTPEQK